MTLLMKGKSGLTAATAVIALALMPGSVPVARAGGGEEDSSNDVATEGPSYYGFVWDTRGATLPGATVALRGKTGKPSEQKTNLMGMYRTHINKDVKPADVVMACEKPGYRQAKVVRRQLPDASAARVQIDCVMQKL